MSGGEGGRDLSTASPQQLTQLQTQISVSAERCERERASKAARAARARRAARASRARSAERPT